ncbi:MAG: PQQ-binding-like beta-propeller repeat protein, partial [Candidatus Hydrothermarchaeales archaeon]
NKSDELIREGIKLEKGGNVTEAVEKYKESLKVFPKSAAGLFLLKLAELSSKGPTTSKEEMGFINLDTRLICDSMSLEVREFLGKRLGNIEFSAPNIEYFFDRFKKIVAEQAGAEVDLLKISRAILFEEPQNGLFQALELELKGDGEAAKEKYEGVLKKAPYLAHAYYLYGIFLELSEDESEAFSRYKQASQHTFDYLDEEMKADVVELFSRRVGYEHLREMDTLSFLKEFLESTLQEEDVSLLRFIRYKLSLEAEAKIKYGFEKEESGESTEAIDAYADAINIDPGNPISHYVLGLAYENRGLEKEAMAEYEKTRGADFRGVESSEDISQIIEKYLIKTTKDGHRVGTILSRYFEIIAEDPEHMLELLGFIEDLKIESISRIIKSHLSTDMILRAEGKVVRDELDFGGVGKGKVGRGKEGRVKRDELDFAEDLDREKDKIERAKEMSKISFELLWKYKTQRSIRCEACTSDGKSILAGSENGIIYFIDQNANSPWRYESDTSVVDIDISSDGKYGVFCNSSDTIELLDCAQEGKSLWKKDMKKNGINSVAISSDADTIAVSTNNFEIIIFDRDGNQKEFHNVDQIIKMLDITDDGDTILAASQQNLFIMRGALSPQMLDAFAPYENIQSIAISKAGDLISVGTKEGSVYLLDVSGQVIWENTILNPVYGVSVSSDSRVVSGAINGTMILYSKDGEQLWKYQTGENIWDVDISEDGDRIICGCGLVFGNVYLFKVK